MQPVILSKQDLKVGKIASMAVSPDGKRVYLGRRHSRDSARENLAVVPINPNDGSTGSPQLYRDSDLPMPLKAAHTTIPVILTDPRYRKLYLIAQHENDGRIRPSRYLTVYDIDQNDDPIGAPRSYEVGKVVNGTVNPSVVTQVMDMALHPTLNRLYMVGHGWHGVRYYDLSPEGEPQSNTLSFKEIPTHINAGKYSIAVSQDGKRLYLGSVTSKPSNQPPADDLQIVDLDEAGVPQTETLKTFSSNAFEPGRSNADYLRFIYTPRALYRIPKELPDGASAAWPLLVWSLDPATGLPIGNGFQPIDAFQQSALAVDPTRQMLWLANDGTVPDAFSGEKISDRTLPLPVPVDGRGFPVLDQIPRVKPVFLQEGLLAAVAANTGMPVLLTQPIPQTVNYVKDYHFRITLRETVSTTPPTPSSFKCTFASDKVRATSIGDDDDLLPLNESSCWENLDALLRDQPDQVLLIVNVGSKPLKHLKLQLQVALGNPNTNPPVQMLTETVVGNQALFLLPGYRFHPERDQRTAIERLSQHVKHYLNTAQTVALAPEERPQRFIVSCSHCVGGQGHLEQLQTQVDAIKSLGFNTAAVYNWGNLPHTDINRVVDADPHHPFHRAWGVYNPLSGPPLNIKAALTYFDFFYDGSLSYNGTSINADTLDQWAVALANWVQQNGVAPEKVVSLALSDEPGWYYPLMLTLLSRNPNLDDLNPPNLPKFEWTDPGPQPNRRFLQAFRDYLAQQGLTPDDLGQSAWEEVFAIGAGAATTTDDEGQPIADITVRRLFYWTMRFFAESASKGHRMAQTALQKVFDPQVQAFANWNNFVSNWYTPSPHEKVGNNPDQGLDAAMGGFDWFTSGRLNAHTLWTEDEFGDWYSQIWSFYGDVLQSAVQHGDRTFGGYVRAYGNRVGAHSAGASYKLLSLVGHGAKSLNVYSFGTAFLFGNCWSEQFHSYRPIAEALKLIGRAERLLFPGQPVPGHVAIFLPNGSCLWDEKKYSPYYLSEIQYLHTALIHAGYRVEFVDDLDISQGVLSNRGYTILYLTGPNVTLKAHNQIATWVEEGGMLVVTPGGGVADEYNEPSSRLDEVLGLIPGSRKAVRALRDWTLYQPLTYKLQVTDPSLLTLLGNDTPIYIPLRGLYQPQFLPFTPLQPQSASVAASLLPLADSPEEPQPSITINNYGKGRAITYSFFPGWQYWNTPIHPIPAHFPEGPLYTDRLPRRWGRVERQLAVIPALMANTPKPVVVSHEVVEVCRLQSDQGIALVILNWTDEPIQTLTLEVPDVGTHQTATSAKGSAVSSQRIGDTLSIQLPIETVDVVLIE